MLCAYSQVIRIDETTGTFSVGLGIGVDVEEERGKDTSLWEVILQSSPFTSLVTQFHKEEPIIKHAFNQLSQPDDLGNVHDSCGGGTCVWPCHKLQRGRRNQHRLLAFLKPMLDVLSQIEYLAGCRLTWAKSSLFWDRFIYCWTKYVEDESFKELVGMT